jgi:menaquinone-dependent protoporphyrinogen oxidase
MSKVLILYASKTGQTAKIAERMEQQMRDQGHTVDCLPMKRLPRDFDIDIYNGILIGAPIRMMKFPKPVMRFVRRYRDRLDAHNAGFFAVCMAAADKRPETQQDLAKWIATFLSETGWQPAMQGVFAGAVLYTQYDFITRMIMKKISVAEGRSTDTSRDHEYTDWDQVAKFTDDYLETLK